MNPTVFCPECPKIERVKRNGDRILVGPILEISEHNYHGCGIDLADCPNCNKTFSISYKVDEVKFFYDNNE